MAQKTTKGPERKPRKNVELTEGKTPEETERRIAGLITSPQLAAYRVINGVDAKQLGDLIDVPHLMEELRRQAQAVNRGDFDNCEAMLMNQATALQSLFARLAERGMTCDTVPGFDANMRMALRAQAQCRATLETLAALKNPPIVIAKQANVTTGPQQVNNGLAEEPRAREVEIAPNKLLEAEHGQWMDNGATSKAIGSDPALATVGTIDGAEDGGG
jgi:hypothetical protein